MRLRLNTVPISDHRDRSTRVPCLVGSIPRSHTSSRTTSLGADHSLRRLSLWAALLAAAVFIELRMKTSSEKLNRNSDDVGDGVPPMRATCHRGLLLERIGQRVGNYVLWLANPEL